MMQGRLQLGRCVSRDPNGRGGPGSTRLYKRAGHSHRTAAQGLGDFFKDIFDFESWAPRSSRAWRLQQFQYPDSKADEEEDASLQKLSERISELRDSSGAGAAPAAGGSAASARSAAMEADALPPTSSFSDADDDELSAALGRRVKQIATTTGEWGASVEEEEMRQGLTGQELRQLLVGKYGKAYDMSFARRSVPGMKTFVCLNIMWVHLGQRSFKITEDQYMEKLDSIAALVNRLGRTDKVRAFLKAPAKSHKGLPARPVVGTAISIQLDLEKEVIEEWFGLGYE